MANYLSLINHISKSEISFVSVLVLIFVLLNSMCSCANVFSPLLSDENELLLMITSVSTTSRSKSSSSNNKSTRPTYDSPAHLVKFKPLEEAVNSKLIININPRKTSLPAEQHSTTISTKRSSTLTTATSSSTMCSNEQLVDMKLDLYEWMDQRTRVFRDKLHMQEKLDSALSLGDFVCEDTLVHTAFSAVWLQSPNTTNSLSLAEWLLASHKASVLNSCSETLFTYCDSDYDKQLSDKEFCSCFTSIQNRCGFIRNKENVSARLSYTTWLNSRLAKFKLHVDMKNYVPLCDMSGLFRARQCNNQGACWCVSSSGRLSTVVVDSLTWGGQEANCN